MSQKVAIRKQGSTSGRKNSVWMTTNETIDKTIIKTMSETGHSPETSHRFFSFWACAALAKAFEGNEFRQNPRGCGLNSSGAVPLGIL